MWFEFLIICCLGLILICLPGFLLCLGIKLPLDESIAFCPLLSIVLYASICICLESLCIKTYWWFVLFSAILLAVFIGFMYSIWKKKSKDGQAIIDNSGFVHPARVVIMFALTSALVGLIMLMAALDNPNQSVQNWDNITHLGLIRTFLETGFYNPLGGSIYADLFSAGVAPIIQESAYYPAAWHMIVALITETFHCDMLIAANATNFIFSFVIFPSGMAVFLMRLFPNSGRKILLGALATVSFTAYPWNMLVFGPLYSQLAGFSVIPAQLALLLKLFNNQRKCTSFILLLASILAGIFLHPSSAFAFGILGLPFAIKSFVLLFFSRTQNQKKRILGRTVICIVLLGSVVLIWLCLYQTESVQRMAIANEYEKGNVIQAVRSVLTLSLAGKTAEWVVAAFCLMGVAISFYKGKRWPAVSYVIVCILYCVAATSNDWIARFLTGFWYKDLYRLAAMIAIAGIPMVTKGLMVTYSLIAKRVHKEVFSIIALSLFSIVYIMFVFCPNINLSSEKTIETPFGTYHQWMKQDYGVPRQWMLTPDEVKFLDEVRLTVGDNELILNNPMDGSIYAYGQEGMSLFYRNIGYVDTPDETKESRIIRTCLNEIGTNKEVQDAVLATGSKYFLQLDSISEQKPPRWSNKYVPQQWSGIESIDEKTPGFELILQSGSMRLYKIDI